MEWEIKQVFVDLLKLYGIGILKCLIEGVTISSADSE